MTDIQVCDYVEAGEDGGDFMGYYAKGFHSAPDFVDACNKMSRNNDRWEECRPEMVKQGWWRTVPCSGEPGFFQYLPAKPGTPGAYKVTFIDMAQERRKREGKIERYGQREGYERGMGDFMDFAYDWVSRADWKKGQEFLEALRLWRHQKEVQGRSQ